MVLDTGHDGRTKVLWLVYRIVPYLFQYTYRKVSAPSQIGWNGFIVRRRSRSQEYPEFCDFWPLVDLIMILICKITYHIKVLIKTNILMGYLLMHDDCWRRKCSLCICHPIFHISGSCSRECQKSFCTVARIFFAYLISHSKQLL